LLSFQQPAEQFVGALEEGAALPVLEQDGAALFEIVLEVCADARGEFGVLDGEVDFVVQTEGTVVEVGRADDA
jgi:hypothetical protein